MDKNLNAQALVFSEEATKSSQSENEIDKSKKIVQNYNFGKPLSITGNIIFGLFRDNYNTKK
jgi:hypothetical protein